MQVSFGKLLEISQRTSLSTPQRIVSDKITDKLENYHGVNIVDYLDNERDTDIVLTLKRNGNIELKLQKEIPGREWDTEDYFVPSDKKNKPLKTEFNLSGKQSHASITKQLNNFLNRCMNYAINGGSKQNERIVENALLHQPRLSQAQEDYLALLDEEEKFIQEFDTDTYN